MLITYQFFLIIIKKKYFSIDFQDFTTKQTLHELIEQTFGVMNSKLYFAGLIFNLKTQNSYDKIKNHCTHSRKFCKQH